MSKTLLFDANNLAIRTLFVAGAQQGDDFDFRIWEHTFLNSIYSMMWKIKNTSEVILAVDDKSWRKQIWPKYKSNRKKTRDESTINWQSFFDYFPQYLDEISSHLPIKVLKIQSAEADDVIGIFAYHIPGNYVVVSADKDYLQLADKVELYDPLKRKMITCKDPEYFLQEQCLVGQKKDNIYNIKTNLEQSDDEKWVRFGPKMAEKIIKSGLDEWLTENNKEKHYKLNRKLMDLSLVPKILVNRTTEAYESYVLPEPDKIVTFFTNKQWPIFLEKIHHVEQKFLTLY